MNQLYRYTTKTTVIIDRIVLDKGYAKYIFK